MQAFTQHSGLVTPLDRVNVDTDAIIPKQFLKSIKRSGFGPNLFDEWRYLDSGMANQNAEQRAPNTEFMLNQTRYADATVLLARRNFGCGSSREHAVWALQDFGFRCVIAPSFADIFFTNCLNNGLLPIVLDENTVARLFEAVEANPGYRLAIDLPTQTLTTPQGEVFGFAIDESRKYRLLNGLDDIGLTLQHAEEIRAYEARRRQQAPWLFSGAGDAP